MISTAQLPLHLCVCFCFVSLQKILRYIRQHLEEIRKMDFPKLPYTCGPVCRVCSKEDRLRVLKVCGDDKQFPTANMQYETFMDLGKYHKVHLTPQVWTNLENRNPGQVRAATILSDHSMVTTNCMQYILWTIVLGKMSQWSTIVPRSNLLRAAAVMFWWSSIKNAKFSQTKQNFSLGIQILYSLHGLSARSIVSFQ